MDPTLAKWLSLGDVIILLIAFAGFVYLFSREQSKPECQLSRENCQKLFLEKLNGIATRFDVTMGATNMKIDYLCESQKELSERLDHFLKINNKAISE